MEGYKKEFIKFMCDAGVLTFGDFVTKSGRNTPYFVNTGNYRKGSQISKLGEFYAECIKSNGLSPDVLFGPAYKGIPLCTSAAAALYTKYGMDAAYCFNRKEEKDHGEGGSLVGAKLKDGDKVVVTEDVITAGTAIRETLPIIKNAANISVEGVVISVDRMEKGKNEKSAVQEVFEDFGIKVYPIVTIKDIMECLEEGFVEGREYLGKMKEYLDKYGI